METRQVSGETLYTTDPLTGMTPLQVAVKKRNWGEVKEMIATPDLDHEKARSGFSLLIAAKENNTAITLELLEKFADFSHATGKNGYFPQHWAVANNNLTLLRAMIAKGADVNHKTKYKLTPLMLAISQEEINKELLAILCEQTKSFSETVKQNAKDGQWQTVTLLLSVKKPEQKTLCAELLFDAIDQNQVDAIKTLLNKGVAYNFLKSGISAVAHAAKAKRWECLETIMNHPNSGCSTSELGLALTIAVAKQHWALATNILKLRPRLDKIFETMTVVQWVIKHNNTEFFNELLDAGIDILTNESNLTTAVQMAVQLRSADILKRLCPLGAKLENAITVAVTTNNHGDLQFLIENGGDTYKVFLKAIEDKQWHHIKFLVEADLDKLKKYLTGLFKAVIDDNKPDMITFLLKHGADPHKIVVNEYKGTPVQYAGANKKWNCVRAFLNSPVKIDADKSNLGCVLLETAKEKEWELFSDILVLKPNLNWRYPDSGKHVIHFVIEARMYTLLSAMLDAGANPNAATDDIDNPK